MQKFIRVIKFSSLLFALQFLSACSMIGLDLFGEDGFFRDRQGDYLEASSIPRIEVPDDKDSYVIDDLLVIPELATRSNQTFVQAPRPRPLQGNPDQAVVIQSLGDRSWIAIDASVSQVWPRVRQYFLENNIELALENPANGLLDTIWFVRSSDAETQEKFRVRVEPGFQNDSAEVSLVHISVPQSEQVSDDLSWPEQSMDDDYAYETLAEISFYLANEIRNYQASTVSFLAGNVSSEGRASILTEDGIDMLHLKADYERSWAAVGRALERANIEIVDEDVDAGVFSVVYDENDEEDDEPGFIDRLISSVGQRGAQTEFSVFLLPSATGTETEVIALREVDLIEGVEEETDDQDVVLINNLIQTIQDFI
jgi:outer membrane protein assembly factor BamC